ncbi:AIPR family protein [Mesorhizobium sp.]|uniref:AIPR family protein n=1 Tax=Mesorhizobium sp. TaxID=1871066 RepID=UPI000FE51EB6|nr:AIPR family protein [Mesorhizobium sp.]RWO98468.1 MAG: hypothetical protein EOQ97_28480 [Mesorhizobium sp.]
MTAEVPIELDYLPPKLHEFFDGRVPLVGNGTPQEKEKNFLSRALAAYVVHKLAGASLEEAAASLVDGGGDGGIDAVHYSAADQKLWLVQSKFISNGRGEPDLGDVTKFLTGLNNLLTGKFVAFEQNAAFKALFPKLEAWFKNSALQVRPVIVYSGIHLISEDRRREIESTKAKFSDHDGYIDFSICNLTTVHDWLTGGDLSPGVESVDLTINKPGWMTDRYETIYGLVPLSEIAALHLAHGKKLIAANIRGFKGRTEVNEQIVKTVESEAENFFYLNNGLTAYCDRLEVNNLDRANPDQKRITARGFSIVNGAQTLGSIAQVFSRMPKAAPKGFAFIRIFSLEKCENEREFSERITRSTNFQNRVELRDFAAQLEQHDLWARQLSPADIAYHYKSDANTPDADDTNFDITEALTACACLAQLSDCDFVVRILANRASLWSFDVAYPETEPLRSRCERIFAPDRSARTVWRAVQTQRAVVEAMKASARAETGVRKAFFENARWLVLNVLFLRLKPETGQALTLSENERTAISAAVNEISEALFTECEAKGLVVAREGAGGLRVYETPKHFRSLFSAPADCQLLRNGLLGRLAGHAKAVE